MSTSLWVCKDALAPQAKGLYSRTVPSVRVSLLHLRCDSPDFGIWMKATLLLWKMEQREAVTQHMHQNKPETTSLLTFLWCLFMLCPWFWPSRIFIHLIWRRNVSTVGIFSRGSIMKRMPHSVSQLWLLDTQFLYILLSLLCQYHRNLFLPFRCLKSI